MPNLAETFERGDIAYQLEVIRLEEGETEKTLDRWAALVVLILAQMRSVDPSYPKTIAGRRNRLNALTGSMMPAFRGAYAGMARRLSQVAASLAEDTSIHIADTVNSLLGVKIFKEIGEAAIQRVAEAPALGKDRLAVWKAAAQEDVTEIGAVLRQAIEAARSLSEMTEALTGTKAAKYQDGLFARIQREQATRVRTQIQAAHNAARYESYIANVDLIQGVQAKNPLDARTSDICRARAGKAWTLDGRAIKGTNLAWPGPPPWHFNCRTVLIPIFRSYDEISESLSASQRGQLDELSRQKKAAIDGKPATDLTFQSYLEGLSEAQQRKVLGPGRYDLWKKGKIAMSDLISKTGKPLTLESLQERIAARKGRKPPQI
jgi:hypothetical protein